MSLSKLPPQKPHYCIHITISEIENYVQPRFFLGVCFPRRMVNVQNPKYEHDSNNTKALFQTYLRALEVRCTPGVSYVPLAIFYLVMKPGMHIISPYEQP